MWQIRMKIKTAKYHLREKDHYQEIYIQEMLLLLSCFSCV